jgi:hypothetical protein
MMTNRNNNSSSSSSSSRTRFRSKLTASKARLHRAAQVEARPQWKKNKLKEFVKRRRRRQQHGGLGGDEREARGMSGHLGDDVAASPKG